MRAARAARLFFLLQPIRALFSGVASAVAASVAVIFSSALLNFQHDNQEV